MNPRPPLLSTLVLLLSLSPPAALSAADVRKVDNLRPLMVEALTSAAGKARGELVGPMFDAIRKHFDARSSVVAAVTRQKKYRQVGCGRLRIAIVQMGVREPQSPERATRVSVFEMDYCSDGQSPTDKTEV
jgi:hypothetical protein